MLHHLARVIIEEVYSTCGLKPCIEAPLLNKTGTFRHSIGKYNDRQVYTYHSSSFFLSKDRDPDRKIHVTDLVGVEQQTLIDTDTNTFWCIQVCQETCFDRSGENHRSPVRNRHVCSRFGNSCRISFSAKSHTCSTATEASASTTTASAMADICLMRISLSTASERVAQRKIAFVQPSRCFFMEYPSRRNFESGICPSVSEKTL